MKDQLLDIVKHTVPLGAFVNLRVDGNATTTEISATEKDKQIVVQGKLHNAITEFDGTFGIPNISVLNTLLNLPVYSDSNSTISVTRNETQPTTVHLRNTTEDFKNDFRLIGSKIIDGLEPKLKLNVANWPVTFVPSVAALTKLKYQSQVNPGETSVTFKLEKGSITAYMGDENSLSGSFLFHSGLEYTGSKTVVIPIQYMIGVLNLTGDKVIHLGDLGIMITIDSGIANYDYILPSLSK